MRGCKFDARARTGVDRCSGHHAEVGVAVGVLAALLAQHRPQSVGVAVPAVPAAAVDVPIAGDLPLLVASRRVGVERRKRPVRGHLHRPPGANGSKAELVAQSCRRRDAARLPLRKDGLHVGHVRRQARPHLSKREVAALNLRRAQLRNGNGCG